MCGRFVLLADAELREVVDAAEQAVAQAALDVDAQRRHAFPGQTIPVIQNSPNALQVNQLTWGFQTDWNKKRVINTRIESALGGSPLWQEAIREGRCIVPAAAFFEPHASETISSPRTGKPIKRAYEFSSPENAPLLLAGVASDGCCSIVTCEPNRWVSPIHPRMPLLLRFDEVPLWLEGDLAGLPVLADRSSLELRVKPEFDTPKRIETGDNQLRLF